jgi:D-arabinose 1-dehydrogenase-like Zn-dependent alcohol dehydrogenase
MSHTQTAPALPRHMKAQFLETLNTPYTLRADTPLPTLTSPHDLLIKVEAASYCHTDAVLASGLFVNPPPLPLVGCHEFAGTVIQSSPSEFKPGDKVGVPGRAFHPCGECDECLAGPGEDGSGDPPGYSNYCPLSTSNGLSRDGGFREYAVVDARQVAPIPAELSAVETAPLMCAGITIYKALKKCGLKSGQRVGIMGCGGGLGHLGLQFATKMGLRVVGVDNADEPLELARGLKTGSTIVDARVESAADVVKQLGSEDGKKHRGEMGVDAVVMLPESQKAFDYGIGLLKNHGKCVVVSFPDQGFHFASKDVIFRDISIVGTVLGTSKMMREMLQFAAQHDVRAIVRSYPLEKLNDLVEEYHRGGGGKLVVDMSL